MLIACKPGFSPTSTPRRKNRQTVPHLCLKMHLPWQNRLLTLVPQAVLTPHTGFPTVQPVRCCDPPLGQQCHGCWYLKGDLTYKAVATAPLAVATRVLAQAIGGDAHGICVFEGFDGRVERVAHVNVCP